MKRILILLLLFSCITVCAQEEDLEISTTATVLNDESATSLILGEYSRTYKVPTSGTDINGIPYRLIAEREYRFVLLLNMEEKEKKHCSGCTGILPARILKVNTSSRQNAVDISRMYKPKNDSER